jgi:TctA family transporter
MELIKGLALMVVSALMGMFAFRVANTWDIPVDNQIAMAFFGCFFFGISIILLFTEIGGYIKRKKVTK